MLHGNGQKLLVLLEILGSHNKSSIWVFYFPSQGLIKDLATVNEALAAEKQQNEKQVKVVVRLQKQLVDKEKEMQKKERQNKVLEMKIDSLQFAVRQVAELKKQKDVDDETIMLQKYVALPRHNISTFKYQ